MARVALVIVNRNSRSGKDALPNVLDGLNKVGIVPIHRDCDDRDRLSELIAAEGTTCDLVVVGGGDGTLNAAAAGIMKINRPLGILPLGTANDLARTLKIPSDLDEAMTIIGDGQTQSIDLGQVNDAFYFNVASVGLSAELCLKLTSDIKRRFGKLGYAISAVQALYRARPFRSTIITPDGAKRSLTLQIAVGNGRYYGGGNVVDKDATITEELLRLYSLEYLKAWQIILMLRSFRSGEHGALEDVLTLYSSEFEVRTRRPKAVNADGEIVTQTPAHFRVLPKAINVFIPRDMSEHS
jgi:diacylglycerol kinase (ATP)